MELFLERLPPGHSSVDLDEDLMIGEGAQSCAVHVEGTLGLDVMAQQVLLSGTFEAVAAAVCDRCTEAFQQRYPAEVEILVMRTAALAKGIDPEDSWIVHQERGIVRLDAQLAEAVLLAQPLHFLCTDQCQGLCPRCGVNLNQGPCGCPPDPDDERWAKLARLRDRQPE